MIGYLFRVCVLINYFSICILADCSYGICRLFGLEPHISYRCGLVFAISVWATTLIWVTPAFMKSKSPFDEINIEINIQIRFTLIGLLQNGISMILYGLMVLGLLLIKVLWFILAYPPLFIIGIISIYGWVNI